MPSNVSSPTYSVSSLEDEREPQVEEKLEHHELYYIPSGDVVFRVSNLLGILGAMLSRAKRTDTDNHAGGEQTIPHSPLLPPPRLALVSRYAVVANSNRDGSRRFIGQVSHYHTAGHKSRLCELSLGILQSVSHRIIFAET